MAQSPGTAVHGGACRMLTVGGCLRGLWPWGRSSHALCPARRALWEEEKKTELAQEVAHLTEEVKSEPLKHN